MCRFEQRITCRAMFTDEKNHYDLKKNSANNQYLASIYGFWNQGQKVSFRYKFANKDRTLLSLLYGQLSFYVYMSKLTLSLTFYEVSLKILVLHLLFIFSFYLGQLLPLIQNVADIGNFRNKAYTDNLILELSMAGAWIGIMLLTFKGMQA